MTMNDAEIEAKMEHLVKTTRDRILRICEGDTEKSDAFLCQIMRYVKDNSGEWPPELRERIMMRLGQLIQR